MHAISVVTIEQMGVARGAIAPKSARLTEHQKPNRIAKRELSDICGH